MSNKTIIKHPIHTFQTHIARERASCTPRKELGRSATASLPTLSGRCKRPFARDIYLYRVDRVSYIWYVIINNNVCTYIAHFQMSPMRFTLLPWQTIIIQWSNLNFLGSIQGKLPVRR